MIFGYDKRIFCIISSIITITSRSHYARWALAFPYSYIIPKFFEKLGIENCLLYSVSNFVEKRAIFICFSEIFGYKNQSEFYNTQLLKFKITNSL